MPQIDKTTYITIIYTTILTFLIPYFALIPSNFFMFLNKKKFKIKYYLNKFFFININNKLKTNILLLWWIKKC